MRKLIALSAVLTTVFVVPFAYMWADNEPPYEYDVENSYIIPSKTESGRQMLVHWSFKKINRVCIGVVTRHIVDDETSIRISYDPTPAARSVELGTNYLNRTFFLPQNAMPGKKWYYANLEMACNPLQRLYPLRIQTPRLAFEVVG